MKNYNRTWRPFVEGRCRYKATKTRNSNPQGWAVEYGGKSKGDRKDNARAKKWNNFLQAQHIHYQDRIVLMVKTNKLQKEVQMAQIQVQKL